ncbi:MAG: DUF2764 family protein [Planctomycetales bacterium]|nr:DUF2764 family protein [Planctomycetales bacterium]
MTKTNYYHLVASLPHMPGSFEVEQVPISRIRLQQRLALLGDDDKRIVEQVQGFLLWDRQHPERTDEEVQQEYDRLRKAITNGLARDIVCHRMDVRTITSGFRRRRLGLKPPSAVGQYVEHIRKHWDHPDFRLVREHPWIPGFRQHFDANEPLPAERQLLLATWNRWVTLADQFHFSFETILLYLARWEIVDRWTRLTASLGRERFATLLTESLGDHVPSHV